MSIYQHPDGELHIKLDFGSMRETIGLMKQTIDKYDRMWRSNQIGDDTAIGINKEILDMFQANKEGAFGMTDTFTPRHLMHINFNRVWGMTATTHTSLIINRLNDMIQCHEEFMKTHGPDYSMGDRWARCMLSSVNR